VAKDELQAWFDEEIAWEDLTEVSRLLISGIIDEREKRVLPSDRVTDRRREDDDVGPVGWLTGTVDILCGPESRWISLEELAVAVAENERVAQWAADLARTTGVPATRILGRAIDAWCALAIAGTQGGNFTIEVAFDESGPLWRTIRPAFEIPEGQLGELVLILVEQHSGVVQGDVTGDRIQVSIEDFEVFLAIEPEAEVLEAIAGVGVDRREWADIPVMISVLSGIDLPDADGIDAAVEAFLADPATPTDLHVELVAGDGIQAWVDRSLSREELCVVDLGEALDELLVAAQRLTESLRPLERFGANPPDQ
jgi:hypothetical protein